MTTQEIIKEFREYRKNRALMTLDKGNLEAIKRCTQVEAWLHLLPKDERLILQKHVIDGLDWPRISVEFDRIWGYQNGRSERTLKRKQSMAIKRICDFTNKS